MQNNKLTTGILFLIVLVLGVIIGKYLISHQEQVVPQSDITQIEQQGNELRQDGFQQEEEGSIKEDTQDTQSAQNGEVIDTSSQNQNENRGTMIVRVPVIGEGGVTTFDPVEVQKSPAVLNAVYHALFKIQSGDGSGIWNGVSFDSVSIDTDSNGKHVAKVRLSRSWLPDGDMSGYVFRRLIDAAAFQYPNIDRVEVYINGNPFDWCIDDMSDGESGCSTHPKLWDDDREYYANHLVITY